MFYFSLTNRLLSDLTGHVLFLSYGSHGRYHRFDRFLKEMLTESLRQ